MFHPALRSGVWLRRGEGGAVVGICRISLQCRTSAARRRLTRNDAPGCCGLVEFFVHSWIDEGDRRAFSARKQNAVKMACGCSAGVIPIILLFFPGRFFFLFPLDVLATGSEARAVQVVREQDRKLLSAGVHCPSGVDRGWELWRQRWRVLRRFTLRNS